MTTEDKKSNEEKRRSLFGFPFGSSEGCQEMMKMMCRPGMKFCDCCHTANGVKDEASPKTSTE
jgi:hypothetical protein